jgi:hypothetical protein
VCAALLAFGGTAMALVTDTSGNTSGTTAPAPTIQSDKADYAPGELVTLTGSGWQPGESVHINVNDDQGKTWSYDSNPDVTADANGNISHSFNLPNWFVATYSVKATGSSGAVATSSFTDADPTTTTLTSSPNPSNVGESVTFTATVKLTSNNNPVTTGSVRFGQGANCGGGFTQFGATQTPNGSGQASVSTSSLSAGAQTIRACYDGTGGQGTQDSTATLIQTVNADATAPNTTIDSSPANPSNSASASFSFNGTDSGTGVASFECKLDGGSFGACTSPKSYSSLSEGSHTFQVRAIDGAGNVDQSPATYTWTVDTVAPVVTLNVNNTTVNNGGQYDFGSVPAEPTCSATDVGGSGVNADGCVRNGYSTAVGSHTLTATATDVAGNVGQASLSYSVVGWTLTNIYQPVDYGTINNSIITTTTQYGPITGMGSVWNTVKGGSTVPLKFEVFTKVSQTELTSTGIVQPLYTSKISCASGTTDEIELVATGKTELRYDTTSGQFIYNWQTPKQPGACYGVSVVTTDGSKMPIAKFQLK